MVITIDGLSCNGKTTLARMLSEKLEFKNFSTGAIYRCIALEIINKNLDINDINATIEKLQTINITFDDNKVYLDEEDVTKEIRTEEITFYSTKWGTIFEIKQLVRKIQKEFIKKYDTIMEGRDIGTRIAPDADFRFYLYADFETRVERMYNQKKSLKIEEIRENLKLIDDLDINEGNFIKPKNAIEIDTTNKNLQEVYEIMMRKIKGE